ncbi:MAG: potassium-transporting ATPase subunit KdpA [Candidatus Nephthysia bennettiae]|uniref:Potassium-transporting ATPase potassium-binding subunit n=1 Tax=Candidatus Nephthysia bennettiae TaxID=3127016 RepID=A0A934N4A8_9BACT|nr:potassium-transporting ATPase subunit KdpA [Candidatus Dormibacteraeota bacterium]PZS00840.1 MAG: potassium-transporting ATPase subunit KdpA [Candidatus Dormibacteraeota bacterium]
MVLDIIGVSATFLAVFLGAWFIGPYLHRVFTGQRVFLAPVVRPVERGFYWISGIKEDQEQSWVHYLVAMLVVQVISLLFTYVILRLQDHLPLNPLGFSGVAPDLAMNTAISFTTNTNWQNYTGEQTMSYLSQMLGLTIHNFLSAATGIALAVALVRGIASRSLKTIGNFYVDATRAILYVLLPISIVGALVLASQGVIQTLGTYPVAHTLDGAKQLIAVGPFASQEVIKDLGNNGGGPFNANSAHPFENPNGFTNQFEIFLELLIPFGLAVMFGRWVGNVKQGLAIGGAMALVLVAATAIAIGAEQVGNPALTGAGVTQASTSTQAGGNMEGKSVRFGPIYSADFAAATTGTSTGSVNSSHDSFTPVGGMVPLVLIQLGEITPGGVGAGLYGMLMFAVIAVFIAGLMVGRTPAYLGKKIESREVRMAVLTLLVGPAVILGFTALSVLLPAGKAGPLNPGAHGFSEILYAFSSTNGNNGSAFAGLTGNTVYYNSTLSAAMWFGRFIFVIPLLALAGSLAGKKVVPAGRGTFATDTPLFAGLIVGVIIIVGALTFFPALALGPLLEHFQLAAGHLAH